MLYTPGPHANSLIEGILFSTLYMLALGYAPVFSLIVVERVVLLMVILIILIVTTASAILSGYAESKA